MFYLEEIGESRGPKHYFYILDEEGDDVGILFLELLPNRTVYIRNIQVSEGVEALGVSGIREILKAIKEEFPEVASVIGHRISGMRRGLSSRKQWTERDI